jgi:hypothetical protein
MRDQPISSPLPTYKITKKPQNKRTQTSMPWVGFEPTTLLLVFDGAKAVHALDRAAAVIDAFLVTSIQLVTLRGLVLLSAVVNIKRFCLHIRTYVVAELYTFRFSILFEDHNIRYWCQVLGSKFEETLRLNCRKWSIQRDSIGSLSNTKQLPRSYNEMTSRNRKELLVVTSPVVYNQTKWNVMPFRMIVRRDKT